MARITQKQLQELQKYKLNAMQKAIIDSLTATQQQYPQLTQAQYKLFEQVLQQVRKKNQPNPWLKKKS